MMLGGIDNRAAALLAIALVAPSVAVGLARFMPVGPASASASSGGSALEAPRMLPDTDVAAVEHTDRQWAMIRAASLADEADISDSPFRTTADDELLGGVIEPVVPGDSRVSPEMPSFQLSSIIAGRRTVAVIDGVARIVGTDLGSGWVIESIDANTQTVLLRHKALGDLTLSLRQP